MTQSLYSKHNPLYGSAKIPVQFATVRQRRHISACSASARQRRHERVDECEAVRATGFPGKSEGSM